MTAPIAPGDWVECVNTKPCPLHGPPALVLGKLYAVEDVRPGMRCRSGAGVLLKGVRANNKSGYFGLSRVAPVYRPSAKLIEQLSQPVDLDAEEPVSVPA